MVMPQQGNVTSFSWNANMPFYCYVSNDDIYHYNGDVVGVSISKYKQVEEALLKCKNRLIELGEIKMPKTPEEIIKEQSEMLEKQAKILDNVMNMYTELKEKVEAVNEHTENKRIDRESTSRDEGQADGRTNGSAEDSRCNRDTDKRTSSTSSTKAKK